MSDEAKDLLPDAPEEARALARGSDRWQEVLVDRSVAKVFVDAGMFKDLKSTAQAMVKIWAGRELGIGDYAAVSMIHMVEGKPEPAGTLVAALVQRHPDYDYTVHVMGDDRCEIEFFGRRDGEWRSLGVSVFTMEMAQQAGLAGKQNWKQYPAAMLFNRAMTQGARSRVPAVYGGISVYAEGEIGGEEPAPNIEQIQSAAENEPDDIVDAELVEPDEPSVAAGAVTSATEQEPEEGDEGGAPDSPSEGYDEGSSVGNGAGAPSDPTEDSPVVQEPEQATLEPEVKMISTAQMRAIRAIAHGDLGWDDDQLHAFSKKESTKDLTHAEASDLIDALAIVAREKKEEAKA